MELFFLRELVVILAASLLIFLVSQRLKLPAVVGFLFTGILIGPSGLGLVTDTRGIAVVAEIGVVMLLFTVGLEFSLERLRQIRKYFWLGGALQVTLTTLLVLVFLRFLRFGAAEGIFYGFLISLSSTAVVLKIYADRGEINSPQGNIALGILLFQDLAMVPMIAVVPILGSSGGASASRIIPGFVLSLLTMSAVALLARYLAPRLLTAIVRTRVREAFIIGSLVMCLGMALLTSSFGLSLALGAFLAGIIISESEYSHQVVSDILPFRDLFNSLFFISIGMLLDLGTAWQEKGVIVLLALSIFCVKTVVVFLTVKMLRHASRIALIAGLSLAQIGEFSFVLANVGKANGFLPENIFQAFIASSILTIFATPFLIQLSPLFAERVGRLLSGMRGGVDAEEKAAHEARNHVIIAGYGLNGRNLARVLKEVGIPYVIMELNPDTVKEAGSRGEPILFGDISSKEILLAAGLLHAKIIVFAISDPNATRRAVRISRQVSEKVFIIVRTRYATEIDELYRMGANEVIPEEFETSIEIFARTLEEFYIPKNIIDAQIKVIRGERYGMLRGSPLTRLSMSKVSELLTAGVAETFFVSEGSVAAGKTLEELSLRRVTGATVIAVVRGEKSFTSPPAEFTIQERDILVLFASHQDMDRAFRFLGGESPEGNRA
jgi:CPA2 family monovalent cation:H+ antiporter-2